MQYYNNGVLKLKKLDGYEFEGFRFDMHFYLDFVKPHYPLISLCIYSDYRVGTKAEWIEEVKAMAIIAHNENSPDPQEATFAYELATIRWSKGWMLVSVYCDNQELVLLFESGKEIHISNIYDDELSWEFVSVLPNNSNTIISCEGNGNIQYTEN